MKVRLAVLVLLLSACGAEQPVQTNLAGGDPGTTAAPTATATPTPTATTTPAGSEAFRTPTGRYVCEVAENGLNCAVRKQQGDKRYPKPSQSISQQCEELAPKNWGNGVTLPYESEAFALCSTDVGVNATNPPVLDYGERWERDGFTCESASEGLTCTRGDHGFFANKDVIETH